MADSYDDGDWEALKKFRSLATDSERLEQMFMTSLSAARSSRRNSSTLIELDKKVAIQNGRISKLEIRVVQVAAVIGFILVALPILLAAVALLGGK